MKRLLWIGGLVVAVVAAGVLLGLATSYGVSAVLKWATDVSTVSVLLAHGFAAAVGIVFGFLPARQAAALMPVEALRYE